MAARPYARVLLKLSGEALLGGQAYGIDTATVARLTHEIGEVRAAGVELAIVIGGGNIFRGMAGAAGGMDRVVADHLGILATVMNAIALASALRAAAIPARALSAVAVEPLCESYGRDRALELLAAGTVVILAAGTGNPYFTTDTAAILRAAETGCDVVAKGTKVDGVYSADPLTSPGATRHRHLTFEEVLASNLAVMDATAIALARDNSIPIIVFSIQEDGALIDIVRGRGRFTTIDDGAG